MKVLVNGGANLSELDGWWAEAFSPEVVWAIGDGREHGPDPARDTVEAEGLYDVLEREVIPDSYERDERNGMASSWLRRPRKSIARLTQEFSATRAIREYTENYYLPAASGYRERAAGDSSLGVSLLQWQHDIVQHWHSVRFGTVNIETHDGLLFFRVEVFLGDLHPDKLSVELYADPVQGGGSVLETMRACQPGAPSSNPQVYCAQVSATRFCAAPRRANSLAALMENLGWR